MPTDFGAPESSAPEVLKPLTRLDSIVDAIPVPVSTSSDTTPTATRPVTLSERRLALGRTRAGGGSAGRSRRHPVLLVIHVAPIVRRRSPEWLNISR